MAMPAFDDGSWNTGRMVDEIMGVSEADIGLAPKHDGGNDLGTALIAGRPGRFLALAFLVNPTFGIRLAAAQTKTLAADHRGHGDRHLSISQGLGILTDIAAAVKVARFVRRSRGRQVRRARHRATGDAWRTATSY
jgi:hypothetical protein